MWFASSPSNETLAGGDPNKVVGIMIWSDDYPMLRVDFLTEI